MGTATKRHVERAVSMDALAFTNTHDLASALGAAMNLINPEVESHHERVAYLSYLMACELHMDEEMHLVTVAAALMHDVGALFSEEQTDSLDFELRADELSQIGADMMGGLPFFDKVADVVRHCQRPWLVSADYPQLKVPMPLASSVVHLADAAAICLKADVPALNQREEIVELIAEGTGTTFHPQVVEAFREVARRDYVWMDLLYHPHRLMDMIPSRPLSLAKAVDLTRVMSRFIDYRSAFTAMHSAGVSASAVRLAELIGMGEDECAMMRIAGNLHDLGKIRTPRAILEKPGCLTDEEFNVIKEHAYFTYKILSQIEGFERICDWAALHHEKLNGTGYPFRLEARQLSLGSRIMAVADIFSAITEERPYRAGMPREKAISVMQDNVASGAVSARVVEVLLDHYDDVNACRAEASEAEGQRYLRTIRRQQAE